MVLASAEILGKLDKSKFNEKSKRGTDMKVETVDIDNSCKDFCLKEQERNGSVGTVGREILRFLKDEQY